MKVRLAGLLLVICVACFAQREAVLKQIDLPTVITSGKCICPVTTGRARPPGRRIRTAWCIDAGSLWRQELRSARAEQLTAGRATIIAGLVADGRWVVFAR